jgi:hypothetical protein
MAEFLAEMYLPRHTADLARQYADRAERGAADLTLAGVPVRCVRSILVPEDETFLLLYVAPSVAAVRQAMVRAGLGWDHISAAVTAES